MHPFYAGPAHGRNAGLDKMPMEANQGNHYFISDVRKGRRMKLKDLNKEWKQGICSCTAPSVQFRARASAIAYATSARAHPPRSALALVKARLNEGESVSECEIARPGW